jgi:hypothetical protein
VFRSVQRFRTVSNQAFLDRGTVRRGGRGGVSILRFASELKNRLLHIFRLEAKASTEAAGEKSTQAQEPRGLARRVEDINGRSPPRACETWKETVYAADGTLVLSVRPPVIGSSEARVSRRPLRELGLSGLALAAMIELASLSAPI